jgi:hypothetical protein
MLDLSPQNMLDEVRNAIDFRQRHTDQSRELIAEYAGSMWRTDWSPEHESPENHGAEYIANFLPNLVYQNPAVAVSTALPGIDDERVEAISEGLNWWVQVVDIAAVLHEIARDMMFDFGVACVTLDTAPGYEQVEPPVPLMPRLRRISPRRFFIDPHAESFETARYMGHMWRRDLEDLKRAKDEDGKPLFDRHALEQLSPDDGLEELDRDKVRSERADARTLTRKEIVGYEIYVRETQQILVLATSEVQGKDGKRTAGRVPDEAAPSVHQADRALRALRYPRRAR